MRRAADLHIQSAQTSHPWSACAFQAAIVASLVAFHTSATGDHVHGLWLVIYYCHEMAMQCNGSTKRFIGIGLCSKITLIIAMDSKYQLWFE